jgi:hypothetical protein
MTKSDTPALGTVPSGPYGLMPLLVDTCGESNDSFGASTAGRVAWETGLSRRTTEAPPTIALWRHRRGTWRPDNPSSLSRFTAPTAGNPKVGVTRVEYYTERACDIAAPSVLRPSCGSLPACPHPAHSCQRIRRIIREQSPCVLAGGSSFGPRTCGADRVQIPPPPP